MSEKKTTYDLGQIYLMSEEEWRKRFARRLWRRMTELDYNQTDVSNITGISRQEIGHYLKGVKTPLTYNVVKLARALNIDVEELID